MSKKEIKDDNSVKRDPDLANAEVALRRAAARARDIARKTGTSVVYSINGKIVKESPPEESHLEENTHRR